jgi:hypothetical protein
MKKADPQIASRERMIPDIHLSSLTLEETAYVRMKHDPMGTSL